MMRKKQMMRKKIDKKQTMKRIDDNEKNDDEIR